MTKGKFALGALLGGVIGAVVGVLAAPKPGKETRADLKAKAEELKKEALDHADELSQEVSKRAQEARTKAEDVTGEAKQKADKVLKDAKMTAADMKTKAEDLAGDVKKTADEYKTRGENAARGAIEGARKGLQKPTPKK